ncbi:MAG: Lrp/AsnC family transcriptional regulator [Anaerovibrio sp.]|uniref:siroheme decarboxylase subunit alpha n=1 Tax=Anaerovibrio sp. TaxID=1872532 RepID=UPI0026011CD0|nr:Lrp/AsnC family transcriptional regulator [Anaerovibrio sp.]MCR5176774.1 Lrp/AsnC family transcriptional regulator [Anaerovibrio sp.]
MELTSFDKQLLNELQGGIQFVSRPYELMAQKLGVSEQVVLERLDQLQQEGLIRKIGAFFNSDKLGYSGTLIAVKVQQQYIAQVASKINEYPEVTHNYQRSGDYALWFTLITNDAKRREHILTTVRNLPGVSALMDLYSQKKYKIDVRFQLK